MRHNLVPPALTSLSSSPFPQLPEIWKSWLHDSQVPQLLLHCHSTAFSILTQGPKQLLRLPRSHLYSSQQEGGGVEEWQVSFKTTAWVTLLQPHWLPHTYLNTPGKHLSHTSLTHVHLSLPDCSPRRPQGPLSHLHIFAHVAFTGWPTPKLFQISALSPAFYPLLWHGFLYCS